MKRGEFIKNKIQNNFNTHSRTELSCFKKYDIIVKTGILLHSETRSF